MSMFKVGDKVECTSTGRDTRTIAHKGVVIEVVAEGKRPNPKFIPMFHKGRQTGTRKGESYVVEVINPLKPSARYLWPLVSKLKVVASADDRIKELEAELAQLKGSKPSELDTDWIICLDSSGSMASCRDGAIKAFNAEVEAVKLAAAKEGLRMPRVTLWTFGVASGVRCTYYRIPADRVTPLDSRSYTPDGGTPMFNCIGDAIEKHTNDREVASNPYLSVVLRIITDGEDTGYATRRAPVDIVRMFNQTSANWTHVFMVPKGAYKNTLVSRFGIPADNVLEWDATNAGAAKAAAVMTSSVSAYMTQRSQGVSRVNSFFVQPDLSKLTAGDLAKLTDLSRSFKLYEVQHEAAIKDFIEGKTGRPYVIGSGYYQLMKDEKKVQAHKGILLRDRVTGKVFGGAEARKLIGLPFGVEAKVVPGNHANFDIFIESTSVNRKLPRGTKVLHDTHQIVDRQPTWNHTAHQQQSTN